MTIFTQCIDIEERLSLFKKYIDHAGLDAKQYQYEGVRWILNNELRPSPIHKVRGGFLADEMGLGKTIMMIGTFLCNFLERTLIVVPPVLVDQWYVQIYKTTGHKALIYHGENKKKITLDQLNKAKIVITTYGAITLNKKQMKIKELTMLHQVKWSRLVFDEAHHLRNAQTTRYISAKLLSAKIRWLVSGTPVQNKKDDFYSLCSMLKLPRSFYTESNNLHALARGFILKRTKSQVGIIIPSVVLDKNIVAWQNRKEMELSQEIHSALAFSGVSAHKGENNIVSTLERRGILQLYFTARQSCIFPKLMEQRVAYLVKLGLLKNMSSYKEAFNNSSKLDFVVKTILERKGNGCGKLIFCHFREEIDEIATRLRAAGMTRVVTFDGRTSGVKRVEALHAKNEALILQIQTGCEGLNLQENYSEIYFISPHWNPAVEDQAIARCHRIGQTKTVFVQRFEMNSFETEEEFDTCTVDNYVCQIQNGKRIIAQECIES
jgi:SNF2 family DNA or RNA helicase